MILCPLDAESPPAPGTIGVLLGAPRARGEANASPAGGAAVSRAVDTAVFARPMGRVSTREMYPARWRGAAARVYFTTHPIIAIDAGGKPFDFDDKREVAVEYREGDRLLRLNAGVEYRGATALFYPKKSFDLEFRDESGKVDVQLGGMRDDDDWVLDGLYNEPLRVNAFAAQRLWNDLYRLPWADEDPRARPGAEVANAEVFVDGSYRGVYHLGEQVDRKLLRLKKGKADGEVRGQLVKTWASPSVLDSASAVRANPNGYVWDGFELKYPQRPSEVAWRPLVEANEFLATASRGKVIGGIDEHLDRANALDYNIFVNVVGGADNIDKNIYLARRDTDSPYVYVVWDLDGTFGNDWDGSRLPATDTVYTPLYHRHYPTAEPAQGFPGERCARYAELRHGGLLAVDSLSARLTGAYHQLRRERIYEREAMVWSSTMRADDAEIRYTERWVAERIAYLDDRFCPAGLPAADAAGIEVSASDEPSSRGLLAFPNPTTDYVTVTGLDDRSSSAAVRSQRTLTLYDVRGVAVARVPMIGERTRLFVGDLPPGIYSLANGAAHTRLLVR